LAGRAEHQVAQLAPVGVRIERVAFANDAQRLADFRRVGSVLFHGADGLA
jgi:hypothetical protein